jgi:hypothetical protein
MNRFPDAFVKISFSVFLTVAILSSATPAHAELVFFSSGRTLSVKGHRMDGDLLVLLLRTGGEIVCDPSVITRIAPDEVPYPEPEPEQTAVEPEAEASEAAVPYGEVIERFAAQHSVPAKLVRAVIQVESAYRDRARSPKGAMGLMQLMPNTARRYAVKDPYDPVSNIEAGVKHLKSLLERFPLALALAAYNAGESAVQRFRGIPPYPETRNYVSRILKLVGR